ncbi:MAG: helix-turn-helix domain-containing protein [Pseudomonadota bacterium]
MTETGEQIYPRDYPVRRLFTVIADAWTPIVLHALSQGTLRFSQLHRCIPDISKKMLTQVLRRLERDGLVERTVYPVVPPHTEYALTEDGRRFHEPLQWLCDWAHQNDDLLMRAQETAAPREGQK